MSDATISAEKAAQYRKRLGLTQDELGLALGKSRRLVQRVEDVASPMLMTSLENHRYAEQLGVHPAELWQKLPNDFTYFGRRIRSGEDLARKITTTTVDDFIVLGAPDNDAEAGKLMRLAEVFDAHQDSRQETSPPKSVSRSPAMGKAQSDLFSLMEIRHLFNALTNGEEAEEHLTFWLITTFRLDHFEDKYLCPASTEHLVIDHSDDRNGGSRYAINLPVIPWITTQDEPWDFDKTYRPEISEVEENRYLEEIPGFLSRKNFSVPFSPEKAFAADTKKEEPD